MKSPNRSSNDSKSNLYQHQQPKQDKPLSFRSAARRHLKIEPSAAWFKLAGPQKLLAFNPGQ